MASYATVPDEAEAEKPLLNRDVRVNLKTVIGGAAVASFVLGALAAAVVSGPARTMAAPTTPPTDAPPNPCGEPCTSDKDCNGKGGFFGNVCLVHGTQCAGHCAKRD